MTYVNEIPKNLSHYDIVVGIPSFNNAETIEHVVKMSAKGIQGMGLKGINRKFRWGINRWHTRGVHEFKIFWRR